MPLASDGVGIKCQVRKIFEGRKEGFFGLDSCPPQHTLIQAHPHSCPSPSPSSTPRDKNHPCIIMWSLGNEAGYGAAHDAMAAYLRQVDPTRPIHYEVCVWEGEGR